MKKISIIIISAVIVILAISGGIMLFKSIGGEDSWVCQNGQWVKRGNPQELMPSGGCGTETPQASVSPSLSPSASPGAANITVGSPQAGQMVSFPFTFSGSARVFENTVVWRLKEKTGKVLVSGITMADSPDVGQFGPFSREINYLWEKPQSEDVVLDVFWNSPMDGSEIDVVSIPLKINLGETSVIKSYFGNTSLAPNDCEKVFPLDRVIPKTQSLARRALEILLEGVGPEERQIGFFTSLNTGVKIKSLVILNTVARADFDEALQAGVGGSCRVTAIRAQITETLKQFSSVQSVIISIDGRTEEILQP